jgi:hypothetical protein
MSIFADMGPVRNRLEPTIGDTYHLGCSPPHSPYVVKKQSYDPSLVMVKEIVKSNVVTTGRSAVTVHAINLMQKKL